MASGLSLSEQIEKISKSGIEPHIGSHWSGRLEEWLATVLPPGAYEHYEDIGSGEADPHDGPGEDETLLEWTQRRRAGVQVWSFPTDELLAEYLKSVSDRREADVLALLRLFLFEDSCFGGDSEHLHRCLHCHFWHPYASAD